MLAGVVNQAQFEADADVARYIADMLCELKQITDAAGCANISTLLMLVHREALVSEQLTPEMARFVSDLLMQLRDLAECRGGTQLAGLLDVAHREAREFAQLLNGAADRGWQPSAQDH